MAITHPRAYSTRARILLYLTSACVSAPSSGLVIWAILHRRGDPASRELGRQCGLISLAAGAIGLTIFALRRRRKRAA
jgi:hypothetical protein